MSTKRGVAGGTAGPAVSRPSRKTCIVCNVTQPIKNFPVQCGRHVPRCQPCHRAWKRSRFAEGVRHQGIAEGEIDAGPFLSWLNAFVGDAGPGVAAAKLHVNERILYRWLRRPSPFVREATVDAMLCAAGDPYVLYELYPELAPDLAIERDGWCKCCREFVTPIWGLCPWDDTPVDVALEWAA